MPSLSVAVRNAMLDALVDTIGSSPVIQIRTGAPPSITSGDSGTLLASFALGASWAGDAASGSVELSSLPITTQALATGPAGHFRLKSAGGTTHASGTVTATDGGGDVELDTAQLIAGLDVSITSWFISTTG